MDMTDRNERINSMSFEEKLEKLRQGVVIPPPDRSYRKLDFHTVWEIALGFMSRGEFQHGDKSAYNWALRHGAMDDVCGHMEPLRKRAKS